MKPTYRSIHLMTVLCCFCSISACGDDADPVRESAPTDTDEKEDTDEATDTEEDPPAAGGDAGAVTDDAESSIDAGTSPDEPELEPDVDALFAVTTQVFGADVTDSYVVLTPSLDTQEPLSLDAAIEVPGRALGVGPANGGRLYVAGDSSPTVTRYDLVGDQLKQGHTISFQGKGLAALGEYGGQFQFVADDKAYYFDGTTAKVIVWDPEAMAVTGDIGLSELVVTDTLLTFSASPVRVGDTLITFAGWREGPAVPSLAGVVAIDTTTDEARVVLDDRCGYVRDGVLAGDGFVYLATEAYGAAVHRLNDANAAPPCLLRFDPVEGEFDQDFHVELNELVGGAPSGSLIVGPNGESFIKVLDEGVFPIAEDTHPRVLASAAAWSWARLELGDEPTVSLLNAPPDNGSAIVMQLGKRSFMALSVGRESTNIVELTADGPGEVTTSVPGIVFSAARLR